MAAIRRFSCSMNAFTRMSAYNVFVRPHVIYCLSVWGNTNATVTNEMNRTLSRSLRIIFGSRETTFSRSLFSSYNICNFQTEVLIQNALVMHSEIYSPTSKQVCFIIYYLHRTTLVRQQAAS